MTNPSFITSTRRRAGALLAACAIALAALAATADARPTLHHGDRGHSVESLQRALHIGADGVYGRGTVRAVKRFQRRHGLHADGIVGGGTWRMIRRSLHRRHTVARSASSASRGVTGRGPSVSAPAGQARPRRRRGLRPGHVPRRQALPAPPRPHRRRRRGPGDVDRARDRRHAPRPQAHAPARRRRAAASPASRPRSRARSPPRTGSRACPTATAAGTARSPTAATTARGRSPTSCTARARSAARSTPRR